MSKFQSAFAKNIPASMKVKIPLSEIKSVRVDDLRPNPRNTLYFSQESTEYFTELEKDIRKRGIIVPLIAKEDGTLLAGHNRLEVARRVGLKFIPVQYVKEELSEEDEREFAVKDNLLRRQLSTDERFKLYTLLYGEEFTVLLSGGGKSGRPAAGETKLTISKIAEDTGQKKSALKMQVKRFQDANKKNGHSVTISPKAAKNTQDNTIAEARKKLQRCIKELHSMGVATEALKLLRQAEKLLK